MLRSLALVVGTFASVLVLEVAARAVDVPVTYTVDEKTFRAGAASGTLLTFELYRDNVCSGAVFTQDVLVDDLAFIERLKLLTPRGAIKQRATARIVHVIRGAPPEATYFVRITGAGVTPVGGICQAQGAAQDLTGAQAIPCLSQVGNEVYFTGCNVNVLSGAGRTQAPTNGLGNLAVGYNEKGSCSGSNPLYVCNTNADCAAAGFGACDIQRAHTGSHNLVIGTLHEYSDYGGFIGGFSNAISGHFAFVSNGYGNTASGHDSSVNGGNNSTASGPNSSVSGGQANRATAYFAWASGGIANTASGWNSSVTGGTYNVASGDYASVSGGSGNQASGNTSSVCGGSANRATALWASVSGGYYNTASEEYASVSGGRYNSASGLAASVSGGTSNTASGTEASVGGGDNVEALSQGDWHAGRAAGFPVSDAY